MALNPNLRTDITERVKVDANTIPWLPSPDGSVNRRPLARKGAEVAVATSLVEYPPGSNFPRHTHALGEEFLVLSGIFSDEHGDFSAGTYVRNPPLSGHAPGSKDGCVIFVKLRQMKPELHTPETFTIVKADEAEWEEKAGHKVLPLYTDEEETVSMIDLPAGGSLKMEGIEGGGEFLVVSGSVSEGGEDALGEMGWFRVPPGEGVQLASEGGCRLWFKAGNLVHGGI